MAFNKAQRDIAQILGGIGKVKPLKPIGPYNPLGSKQLVPDITSIAATQQKNRMDAASYILARSSLGKGFAGPTSGQSLASQQEDEDPGIITKLFDTMSIPLNIGMNAINEGLQTIEGKQSFTDAITDQAKEISTIPARIVDNAFWKPNIPFTDLDEKFYQFADKIADKSNRTTGADVLTTAGQGTIKPDSKTAIFGGLAADLVGDPLNFVGVGLARAPAKIAEAASAVSKLDDLAAARKGVQAFTKPTIPTKEALHPPVAENLGRLRGGSKFRYDPIARQHGQGGIPRINLPGFGNKFPARQRTTPGGFTREYTPRTMKPGAGPGETFHGTSQPWENRLTPRDIFDEQAVGPDANLYGRGLYTTKSHDVANSYTTIRGGNDPRLYKIRWRDEKNPPRFVDMDAPATPEVMAWAKDVANYIRNNGIGGFEDVSFANESDGFNESLTILEGYIAEVEHGIGAVTNDNLYEVVRDVLSHHHVGYFTHQDMLDEFTQHLMSRGYDGLKHTGGRRMGATDHEVNIFFDPNKLHVTEVVPEGQAAMHGAANLPPEDATGLTKLANPFDADTAKIIEDIRAGRISGKPPKVPRSVGAKIRGDADRLQDQLLASNGVVRSGKGFNSYTAADRAVEAIRRGEIPAALTVKPLQESELANAIRRSADKFLDKTLKGSNRLTPDRQVNLFERVFNNIDKIAGKKVPAKEKLGVAISALRTAEEHLTQLGKTPQYWDGVGVPLSEVLADTKGLDLEVVLNNFRRKGELDSQIVKDAISRARARRSMVTGSGLQRLSSDIANLKNFLHNTKYATREQFESERAINTIRKQLKETSKLTPEESHRVQEVLRRTINVDKLPPDFVLSDAGPMLAKAVATGKADADTVVKELKAIHKMLGEKELPTLTPNASVKEINGLLERVTHNAVGAFGIRMATWWGRPDVIRFEHDILGHGESNARVNAMAFRQMQKQFQPDEIKEAWQVATGRETAQSTRTFGLAGNMQAQMEHIFGSSGLRAELGAASHEMSVAQKSQLAMYDINKELKRLGVDKYFSFTNKNLTRAGGKDYSQGMDWLHSWEEANPPDPAAFLYDVNLAMERTTKRYAFYDELAFRFGSRRKGAIVNGLKAEHETTVPRLDGWHFPEEIKNQIQATERAFDQPQWRAPNGFHNYAKALKVWKIGVTIYNPSHHIRNLIGDSWLMWMGGINDPKVFLKSQRILHTQKSRYRDVMRSISADDPQSLARAQQELGPLYSRWASEWSGTRRADVVSKITKKGKTTRVNASEYWQQAHKHNLLLSAGEAEDIFGQTPFGKLANIGPVAKLHEKVTKLSEYREHYVRMAHFVGETEKGLKRGLSKPQAFEQAAHAVRKWHPDGRDLTHFEQNLRLMIPFYSWIRKSTPLILQSIVQRPAKVLAYPKIMTALSQSLGIDASMEDPFPDDQLFPDWIRSQGMSPIGNAAAGGLSGLIGRLATYRKEDYTDKPLGYAIANPSNPMVDMFSQYLGTGSGRDIAGGIGESLTPFARIPAELLTGTEMSGAPIESDPGGYITENLPFIAPFSRMANFGITGRTAQGLRTDTNNTAVDKQAIVNWLTAMGLQGTGPYNKTTEFEARARAERYAKRRTYSK